MHWWRRSWWTCRCRVRPFWRCGARRRCPRSRAADYGTRNDECADDVGRRLRYAGTDGFGSTCARSDAKRSRGARRRPPSYKAEGTCSSVRALHGVCMRVRMPDVQSVGVPGGRAVRTVCETQLFTTRSYVLRMLRPTRYALTRWSWPDWNAPLRVHTYTPPYMGLATYRLRPTSGPLLCARVALQHTHAPVAVSHAACAPLFHGALVRSIGVALGLGALHVQHVLGVYHIL